MNKYPQGVIGYLFGLGIHNMDYFISEFKLLESSFNIDDFFNFCSKNIYFIEVGSGVLKWILINYHPKITPLFFKRIFIDGSVHLFKILNERYNLQDYQFTFFNSISNRKTIATKFDLYLEYNDLYQDIYDQIYKKAINRKWNFIIDVLDKHYKH